MLQYLSDQPVENQRGNGARMPSTNAERNLREDGTENGSIVVGTPGSTRVWGLF